MQKLMVIALALGLAACGKKGGIDGKLDELQKIKDEVCACKDKACADAAHDKYTAWKKNNSKEDKPSDDQMKKFEELRGQLNECRHKLSDTAVPAAPTGSATPTETAPPAPVPAGSAQ